MGDTGDFMKNNNEKRSSTRIRMTYCVVLLSLIVTFCLIYSYHHSTAPVKTYENIVCTPTPAGNTPKVAIIIDDFGQSRLGVKEMMSIERPLTFAIMPFLDYSTQDATNAHNKGFEVILHLPMQSTANDIPSWLGPNPVRVDHSNEKIKEIVSESIDSIPHVKGVNIHMGSMASEDQRVMQAVAEAIKEKNLFLIDSKTSSLSICEAVAQKAGIPFSQRDIFLENAQKEESYIKEQLEQAAQIAVKRGSAVVIGHVGSAGGVITAKCIKEMIPVIEKKGISFVFISQIV
jgi:polysaccharide deacetylase 2 family uncharacterized protein YibQ